jgi:hypothetical protein
MGYANDMANVIATKDQQIDELSVELTKLRAVSTSTRNKEGGWESVYEVGGFISRWLSGGHSHPLEQRVLSASHFITEIIGN